MSNRHICCGRDQTSLTIDRLVDAVMEDAVSPKGFKPFVFDYVDHMTTVTSPSKTNCLKRLAAGCLAKITTDPCSQVRTGKPLLPPVGIGVIDSQIGSCENHSINQEAVCSLSNAEQRRAAGSTLVELRQNPILVNANANGTLVPTLSLLGFRIAPTEKTKEDQSDVLPAGVHNLSSKDPHQKPSPENSVFNVKTEPVVMEGSEFEKQQTVTDVETSSVPESTTLSDHNLPLGNPQQRPSLENSLFDMKVEPFEMEDGVCDKERTMTKDLVETQIIIPESTILSDHISPWEHPQRRSPQINSVFDMKTEPVSMENGVCDQELTMSEDLGQFPAVPDVVAADTLSRARTPDDDGDVNLTRLLANACWGYSLSDSDKPKEPDEEEVSGIETAPSDCPARQATDCHDNLKGDLRNTSCVSSVEDPREKSPENSMFDVKTESLGIEDNKKEQSVTKNVVEKPSIPEVVSGDTLHCIQSSDDSGETYLMRLLASACWGFTSSSADCDNPKKPNLVEVPRLESAPSDVVAERAVKWHDRLKITRVSTCKEVTESVSCGNEMGQFENSDEVPGDDYLIPEAGAKEAAVESARNCKGSTDDLKGTRRDVEGNESCVIEREPDENSKASPLADCTSPEPIVTATSMEAVSEPAVVRNYSNDKWVDERQVIGENEKCRLLVDADENPEESPPGHHQIPRLGVMDNNIECVAINDCSKDNCNDEQQSVNEDEAGGLLMETDEAIETLSRAVSSKRGPVTRSMTRNAFATSRHTQGTETMVVDDGSDCHGFDDWVAADASESDGDASWPHAREASRGKPVLETVPRDVCASGAELQETADHAICAAQDGLPPRAAIAADDLVACKFCDERYAKLQLEAHVRTHDGKECHKCGICEARFSTAARLSSHYRRMHSGMHECHMCDKLFASADGLKTHRRTHLDDRSYQCDACDKAFKTRQSLYHHRKVHSDRKPYECKPCNRRFKYKQLYTAHREKVHLKISTEHLCGVCGRLYRSPQALYHHMRRHRGDERRHGCDVCGRRFYELHHMRKHRLIHEGVKPFECLVCKKYFRQKHSLTCHQKRFHPIQAKPDSRVVAPDVPR